MSTFALALVLGAALMHASWNAIVKGAGDRSLVLAMVATGHVLTGAVAFLFVGFPAWAAWPFIIASAVIHYAYYALLFLSYRVGDLSQVYPIARGVAPVLVSLGALVFAGEMLSPGGWTAVALVSAGIGILAIGQVTKVGRAAILLALATGVIIASYSVVDGIGIRLSEATFGYIAWIFFLEFPIVAGVLWKRGQPLSSLPRRTVLVGLAGGFLSSFAYAPVLYAKTIAPIGAVSAVRESSVIFAALIGVLVFGERPWGKRLIAAIVVAAGVGVLAVSG